ncbi:DUF3820 family protein [Acidithiobacillus montserratensis]|uniref:DUF3820 family protein n=1 Tax=Acidithiobacillus montserratensis TaxID=2729135 RepID=A0ACD5HIY5_9PROT
MPQTIIIDTETTGRNEPQAVEIAWIAPNTPAQLQTVADFQQRYLPDKPIEFGAMATHHILPADLEGCPSPSDFALPPDTAYIIGHNIDYDWQVIGSPDVRRICTLAMARRIWPNTDSHSLSALTYFLATDLDKARRAIQNAHSAWHDIHFTRDLLACILKEHPVDSWDELWHFSEDCRIPTHMPFGKHRGVPIPDLPADYVAWARRNLPDMDPYLRTALNRAFPSA